MPGPYMTTEEKPELKQFLDAVHQVHGYDFTDYSEASIQRRINHFLLLKKIDGMEELKKLVLKDEKLFEEFVQELSVTVTEMFRDPTFYLSLRRQVVSQLATYPVIKIWIAGCATGEEVYSVAILLREEGLLQRSIIYATDINQKSLSHAREGVFDIDHMKTYTVNYQKAGGKTAFSDYYTANYNAVIFDQSLRQNIVFSPHNLSVDKSFNEFQLIICRNVLIYFNQRLQNKVLNLFYESLCPFGFLALGNKESLLFTDKRNSFEDIDKKEKIYKRLG